MTQQAPDNLTAAYLHAIQEDINTLIATDVAQWKNSDALTALIHNIHYMLNDEPTPETYALLSALIEDTKTRSPYAALKIAQIAWLAVPGNESLRVQWAALIDPAAAEQKKEVVETLQFFMDLSQGQGPVGQITQKALLRLQP